jgi:hypothetical protein
LPEKPIYKNAVDVPDETVVEPAAVYHLSPGRAQIFTPDNVIDDILAGRTYFYAYGYVSYRDFMGEMHVVRFIKQLVIDKIGANVTSFRFIDGPDGPYSDSF